MFRLLNKSIPLLSLFTFQALISSYKLHNIAKKEILTAEGFAVVELFTSEGCSSCPPADEVVGRLNGWKINVYVLSFHVDYWNYLGWKDVYSNPSYSSRQQNYGSIFQLNSIYTPQIIVNGKSQFVGSDESRLRESIAESLKEIPRIEIHLKVQLENKNKIVVTCNTVANPDLKLNLALVQNFATNFIQRGENKGKILTHYFTVRDFRVLPNQDSSNAIYLTIPPGLQASDCTIIAFLQNPKTGYIIAAARSSIP